MFEKYTVCDVCGLKSLSFVSNTVLYITPIYTLSVQELTIQGMQQNQNSPAFD